jgi:HSP20 family protein
MLEETDRLLAQQQGLLQDGTLSSTTTGFAGFPVPSPRYELIDNEEKFQLSMDVPGVKPENMSIDLDKDGGYLTIRGERESSNEYSRFASKFSQTFSLDSTVMVDHLTANLNNGVLVVTAPKDVTKLEEKIRKIPIMSSSSTATLPTVTSGSGEKTTETKEDSGLVVGNAGDHLLNEPTPATKEEEEVLDLDKN